MSGGRGPNDSDDDSGRPDAGSRGRTDSEDRPGGGRGGVRQGEDQGDGSGQGRSREQDQQRGSRRQGGGQDSDDGPGRQGGPQQSRPGQGAAPQGNHGRRGVAQDEQRQNSPTQEGQAKASSPRDGREQAEKRPTGGTSAAEETAVDRAAGMTDSHVLEWLSLEPDEASVWVGEPTKLRLVGTAVTGVILIPFLIGILVLGLLPVTYLSLTHTDYVVTNRSLYVKKGVLSTNVESIDLDRIQNTEFTQSFWGKQLGFGTIDVSTAGSSGADISFSGIEDAREVRDQITRVQREFAGGDDRRGRDGTGGGGRASTPADDAQVAELVSELRATREALERVAAKLDEGDGDPDEGTDERTRR